MGVDPTAVMGRRIVAWVIDLLLFLLVMSFVGPTPLSPLAEYHTIPSGFGGNACEVLQDAGDATGCFVLDDRVYFTTGADTAVAFLVALAWFLLIYGVLQGTRGVTPGKALLGVAVVEPGGQPPGVGRSLLRSLLYIVDGFPYCFPLVGLIVAFSSKGHRRVGDMVANTFVVGKAWRGRPVVVPGMTPAGAPGYPPMGPAPGPYDAPGGYQQPGAWGAPPPAGSPPTGYPPAQPAPQPTPQPAGFQSPWATPPGDAPAAGMPAAPGAATPPGAAVPPGSWGTTPPAAAPQDAPPPAVGGPPGGTPPPGDAASPSSPAAPETPAPEPAAETPTPAPNSGRAAGGRARRRARGDPGSHVRRAAGGRRHGDERLQPQVGRGPQHLHRVGSEPEPLAGLGRRRQAVEPALTRPGHGVPFHTGPARFWQR